MEKLTLIKKWQEHGTVFTFSFSADTQILYKAGQYVHLMLPWRFFPFFGPNREISFASAPGDEDIRFTIETKSGSSYQRKLLALEPGDTVTIFVDRKNKMNVPDDARGTYVFIAGGVGMTPFRSLLRDIEQKKIAVTLILIQVDRDAYLYEEEFKEKSFEQHRIGRADLAATLQKVAQGDSRQYFVAGSPSFVTGVTATLRGMGVSASNIHRDDFKGLKD